MAYGDRFLGNGFPLLLIRLLYLIGMATKGLGFERATAPPNRPDLNPDRFFSNSSDGSARFCIRLWLESPLTTAIPSFVFKARKKDTKNLFHYWTLSSQTLGCSQCVPISRESVKN